VGRVTARERAEDAPGARLENGGTQDIIQWSQAVGVREPEHDDDGYEEHDEH
jgi:hypothetical protein